MDVVRDPVGMHLLTEVMPYGELYDALDSIVFSEQACRMVIKPCSTQRSSAGT